MEPTRPPKTKSPSDVPYDTDPAYNTMLSRLELTNQIDRMIKNTSNPSKSPNIHKLINEVVSQLKLLESGYNEVESPRTEIENAKQQIQSVRRLIMLIPAVFRIFQF